MNPAIGGEGRRQAQPLEPAQQLGHGRGGGQDHRGGHPEGALGHDVPGRPEPLDRQRHAQHLDPLTLPDERQEHGEEQERQLDDEAPGQGRQAAARPPWPGRPAPRRTPRRPRRPRGGWPPRPGRTGRRRPACTGAGRGAAGSSPGGRARGCGRPPPVRAPGWARRPRRCQSSRRRPRARPHGPEQREQRQPDPEGDQHPDQPGEAGAEPLVVDALDRVVGQRAVGEQVVLGGLQRSPCPRPPAPGRRASRRRSR